jgi:hypothetical protein
MGSGTEYKEERTMKAIQGLAGLGLCLLGVSFAHAQAAGKCSAVVTRHSVTPNANEEKTWDIQFNVMVNGCEMSGGTFEYVAQIEASQGRTELQTVPETFNAEKSGNTRFTVSFHAPPGKELKDVRSASVKTCTCLK